MPGRRAPAISGGLTGPGGVTAQASLLACQDQTGGKAGHGERLHGGSDQQRCRRGGRLWSQVVAVAQGVPANVVAVWSQSGNFGAASDPVTGR
jgi:hypothetical protein